MTVVQAGDQLTDAERFKLDHHEQMIENSKTQIWKSLAYIRDNRLYRETHSTFEDYSQERWGISKRHANRQIMAGEVADVLGPIGPAEIPEGQARELAPLRDDPEQMREVYEKAKEATGGNPTAKAIKEAREPRPRRGPIKKQADHAGWELRKAVERVERVFTDDRLSHKNWWAIKSSVYGHMDYAVETLGLRRDQYDGKVEYTGENAARAALTAPVQIDRELRGMVNAAMSELHHAKKWISEHPGVDFDCYDHALSDIKALADGISSALTACQVAVSDS